MLHGDKKAKNSTRLKKKGHGWLSGTAIITILSGNKDLNRMLNHDLRNCSLGLSALLNYYVKLFFGADLTCIFTHQMCDFVIHTKVQLISPKLFPCCNDFHSSRNECCEHEVPIWNMKFSNSLSPRLSSAHPEWATVEHIMASKVKMWTGGPVIVYSKPKHSSFCSIPHQ